MKLKLKLKFLGAWQRERMVKLGSGEGHRLASVGTQILDKRRSISAGSRIWIT